MPLVAEHGDAARFGDAAADGDAELAQDVPAVTVAVERVRPEVEAIAVAEMGDGASAEVAAALEDRDGAAGTREIDGCGEAGQTSADDDDVL